MARQIDDIRRRRAERCQTLAEHHRAVADIRARGEEPTEQQMADLRTAITAAREIQTEYEAAERELQSERDAADLLQAMQEDDERGRGRRATPPGGPVGDPPTPPATGAQPPAGGQRGDADQLFYRARPEELGPVQARAARYLRENLYAVRGDEYQPVSYEEIAAGRDTVAHREAWRRGLLGLPQQRALQVDHDTQAGILTAPLSWVAELVAEADLLQIALPKTRKFFIAGESRGLGIYTRLGKMSTMKWSSELGTPAKDTSLKFGARELFPKDKDGEILVSRKLLRMQTVLSVDGIVRGEFARDDGELTEQALATGSGTNQPLGVFTAHKDGIPTSRDVPAASSSTVTLDDVTKLKYAVRQVYWQRAGFQLLGAQKLHEVLNAIRDGNNRPVWRASDVVGQPDRVEGIPAYIWEFAPSTFTTGQYVAILGDWGEYATCFGLSVELQVLVEKYAETNQVAYIYRATADGQPLLAEPWARLKLA